MTPANHRIHLHWSLREVVYRLLDTSGIVAGMCFAATTQDVRVNEFHLLAGAASIILFYLFCEVSGMYRNWRGEAVDREILCATLTWGAAMPAVLSLAVMTQRVQWIDRSFVIVWWFVALAVIVFNRMIVRWTQRYLRSRGLNTRGFAVVGVNDLAFELVGRIGNSPEMGLQFVGFYDDRTDQRLPDIPSQLGPKIGSIEQLVKDARSQRVNMIYITFPMRAEDRIRKVLTALGDTTASVYIVPDFFVFELLHSRWTNISGLPAVSVFENPLYGVDGLLKRAVDIVFAALFLTIAALPMVVIAVLVKLSSPGPIFFRQKRYGLDGREIMVWKFRSMTVCESGDSCQQATRNDSRTTRIGAVLRKTSLDELPQLFNVLEGNMSLVGPRPHATKQNEEFRTLIQGYMLRHKVKPGITGLAQVNGWRGETDTLEKMERRVECDHRYIREWSLFMDLKILFRTIFVVLSRQNAY